MMTSPMMRMIGALVASGSLMLSTGCADNHAASAPPQVYQSRAVAPSPMFAAAGMPIVAEHGPAELNAAEGKSDPVPDANAVPAGSAQPAPADTPVAAASPATNAPALRIAKPAEIPHDLKLSTALEEVVRMVQAGVTEEVLLAYISNTTNIFNVGADEIVYLNDLGISTPVITKLIEQDASPGSVARKHTATAAKPLPPELVLRAPATNIYPTQTAPPPPSSNPPGEGAEPPVYANQANTAPAAYVGAPTGEAPTTASFQSSLSPYGNWVEVPEYGLCWQPTVVIGNPAWRPYSDNGCWYWTDRGWYWHSYYSWGWAPFHYGRWYRHTGYGWVWTPDTYWGPAWVTWRYTPYYCGWAPLPPRCHYVSGFGLYYNGGSVGMSFDFGYGYDRYSYVHWNHFGDRYPHRYYVRHDQAYAIHRESTVVNNYVVQNNTVINTGVGLDRAARLSRSEIRRAVVRDVPASTRTGARSERVVGEGNSTVLERATLPPGSRNGNSFSGTRPATRDAGSAATAAPSSATRTIAPTSSDSGATVPDRRPRADQTEAGSPPNSRATAAAPAVRSGRPADTAPSAAAASTAPTAPAAPTAAAPASAEPLAARSPAARREPLVSPRQTSDRPDTRSGVVRPAPRSESSAPATMATLPEARSAAPDNQSVRASTLARPAPVRSMSAPPSTPPSTMSPAAAPPQYRSEGMRSEAFTRSAPAPSAPVGQSSTRRSNVAPPSQLGQPSRFNYYANPAPRAADIPSSPRMSSPSIPANRFSAPAARPSAAPAAAAPAPVVRSAPRASTPAAPAASAPSSRPQGGGSRGQEFGRGR